MPSLTQYATPRFWRTIFLSCGFILVIAGLISIINAFLFFRESGFVHPAFMTYILLKFSFAYGFFTRQKWLVAMFGLTWLGAFLISSVYVYDAIQYGAPISAPRIVFVLAAITAFFLCVLFGVKYLEGRYFQWPISYILLSVFLLALLFNLPTSPYFNL